MRKYKYYFKKPRSEIAKDVIKLLLASGAIIIAAQSPYFIRSLLNYKNWKKYSKNKIKDTFYNLRKQGFIEIERNAGQIYIRLTEEGRKKAGMYQIGALKIKKPKNWDRKWRLVIFDIAELKKIYREAFRGKIKELGFHCLQKSVWVHPFNCRAEIELLRDFFGLSERELRLVVTEDIGEDRELREHFGLLNV